MHAKRKKPVHENLNCFSDGQPFQQVVIDLSPVGSRISPLLTFKGFITSEIQFVF